MRISATAFVCVVLSGCGGGSSAATTTNPAAHSLRYAVLGDSYSNGQSVSPQCAWPVVMARLLTRRGLPVSVVANPSVTGATTAQMIGIGVGPITASHPDVMTVMLGVNDEFQGHTTGQFAADYYQALGDAIKITGSPSRVLAVDIPDYAVTPFALQVGPPGPIAARIELFNRVLRSVASLRGVQVVSVFGISRHDGAAELANDGLHPSCSQLAQWARHIGAVAFRAWRHFAPRSS